MGGQYGVAWTADYNDYVPEAGEAAMGRLLSYQPSKVRPLSSNLYMRIPVSLTQKWYYLRGSENSDTEYGKILLFVASPLANVTGSSTTSIIVRIRWSYEFSYPELPAELKPDATAVYASAGTYFTDSSGDWKAGAYLTFKWHEGGDITAFPQAQAGIIYKVTDRARVQYYRSNGTIGTTQWAVCVTDQTEENLPMLAPVANEEAAKAWAKDKADSHLLPYYGAGPWVYPENPPWFPQQAKAAMSFTRTGVEYNDPSPVNATFRTYDQSADRMAIKNKKLLDNLLFPSTNPLDRYQGKLYEALTLLSRLDILQLPEPEDLIGNYLKTVGPPVPSVIPVLKTDSGVNDSCRTSESSYEVLDDPSAGGSKRN